MPRRNRDHSGSRKKFERQDIQQPIDKYGSFKMDTYLGRFKFMNYRQELAYQSIMDNTITILAGASGAGKTLIALAAGIALLEKREVDKILYLRSNSFTDFQKSIGALPGEYNDKIKPLFAPLTQNAKHLVPPQVLEYLLTKEKIQLYLVEDILGTTFERTFIIFDEAQATIPLNIRGALTRIGRHSKMVLCGDTRQTTYKEHRRNNGLEDALVRLQNLKDVGIITFKPEDVVRNQIIPHILERYEDLSY